MGALLYSYNINLADINCFPFSSFYSSSFAYTALVRVSSIAIIVQIVLSEVCRRHAGFESLNKYCGIVSKQPTSISGAASPEIFQQFGKH